MPSVAVIASVSASPGCSFDLMLIGVWLGSLVRVIVGLGVIVFVGRIVLVGVIEGVCEGTRVQVGCRVCVDVAAGLSNGKASQAALIITTMKRIVRDLKIRILKDFYYSLSCFHPWYISIINLDRKYAANIHLFPLRH